MSINPNNYDARDFNQFSNPALDSPEGVKNLSKKEVGVTGGDASVTQTFGNASVKIGATTYNFNNEVPTLPLPDTSTSGNQFFATSYAAAISSILSILAQLQSSMGFLETQNQIKDLQMQFEMLKDKVKLVKQSFDVQAQQEIMQAVSEGLGALTAAVEIGLTMGLPAKAKQAATDEKKKMETELQTLKSQPATLKTTQDAQQLAILTQKQPAQVGAGAINQQSPNAAHKTIQDNNIEIQVKEDRLNTIDEAINSKAKQIAAAPQAQKALLTVQYNDLILEKNQLPGNIAALQQQNKTTLTTDFNMSPQEADAFLAKEDTNTKNINQVNSKISDLTNSIKNFDPAKVAHQKYQELEAVLKNSMKIVNSCAQMGISVGKAYKTAERGEIESQKEMLEGLMQQLQKLIDSRGQVSDRMQSSMSQVLDLLKQILDTNTQKFSLP